jgi:hypothetical protein
MKTWIYKNAAEEINAINQIIQLDFRREVIKHHNIDGSGRFDTTPEFGTILWAIQSAKKQTDKAKFSGKKAIKTNKVNNIQFYIDILFSNTTISGKRGYLVLTESELNFANGYLTSEEYRLLDKSKDKKYIVCANLTIDGKSINLLPLR